VNGPKKPDSTLIGSIVAASDFSSAPDPARVATRWIGQSASARG
jgi:hypothetical protein